MELYDWQDKVLNHQYNDKALWCCEAGTGKTHAAALWLQQGNRSVAPVVLCPKQIKKKWGKLAPTAVVMTPYEVRTYPERLPKKPSAVVVDECDEYASPLFIAKKRSKMAEVLYNYIRMHPGVHIILLTATPIRSTPWNLHTLLTYIGRYQDWREYQKRYFELGQPYFGGPMTWLPRRGWQRAIQKDLEQNSTIALMQDITELPSETHEIITLKEPKYEKNKEWEASKQFVEDHRLEQCGKDSTVKDIARGFRKVVVVAHYTKQIDDLRDSLSKTRETFVLDGRTKDAEQVIADAEASGECFFIIQASVGAGFEIPSFSCMIFASQGYSVRNLVQMKARIRRINNLKPVKYYYLHAGRCDRQVHESIQNGKDFVPSEYKRSG